MSENKYKAIKVNGRKTDEHRYIMEQFIGRKLSSDEVVHHINGDKSDNRIENLEICKRSEHSRSHRLGKHLSAETRAKLHSALKGRRIHHHFTNEQILEIRQLSDDGQSAKEIAALYDVAVSTIYRIVGRKTYQEI